MGQPILNPPGCDGILMLRVWYLSFDCGPYLPKADLTYLPAFNNITHAASLCDDDTERDSMCSGLVL